MADPKLDEAFGIKPAAAQSAPAPSSSASDDNEAQDIAAGGVGSSQMKSIKGAAAKTLQSATFGFGADAAGAIFGKQAEDTIRQLEKNYDKENPLSAFGIDLAVGVAQGALTGGDSVPATAGRMIGKGAIGGALYGGLQGAGSGGSLQERAKKATEGAVTGGLIGGAAGVLGALVKPGADRLGKMGFNQDAEAAKTVQAALKADGKTPQQLESFMRQNPNARIADFSPKVADLIGDTGGLSNPLARQLGTNLREDMSGQLGRLQNPSQPLLHVKQQLADNLDTLQQKMSAQYRTAYSEVTPLTPELKAALDHPEVKPLVDDVLKDYREARGMASAAVSQAPKYKVGQEIPTAVVDDLQKRLRDAASDPANIGKLRAGAFQAAHSELKNAQPASLDAAQRLAATIGGEESKTGIIGAQTWGSQFAMGLKSADIEAWRGMNPLQKQYARIGMVDGMERYLRDKGQMTEGSLTKLADKMDDPMVREVLGNKEANQVKKVFKTEAARSRTSSTMARGGSSRAQFEEENLGRAVAHMANVGIPGAHSVVGTAMRVLKSVGVPEARASAMIDIATKPGGLARLKAAGVQQNVLDVISQAVKPSIAGRLAGEQQTQSQR